MDAEDTIIYLSTTMFCCFFIKNKDFFLSLKIHKSNWYNHSTQCFIQTVVVWGGLYVQCQ